MTTPDRQTRRPNGRAPWPFICLAGVDKAGKTWAALEASASPLIGRTFVIPCGEDDFDQYAAIPGADYEIVTNDGTYADLVDAVEWAVAQDRLEDGRPNLVVFDSGTELWDMLKAEQSIIARRRAAQKAARTRRAAPKGDDEVSITMDQWNVAKDRWARVMVALRNHDGPSIITSRLELVTIMDGAGQPTRDKEWRVQVEKNIGYLVTGTVQLREYRKAILTGARSVHLQADPDESRRLPTFTLDGLWRAMGMENTAMIEARRVHTTNASAGADQIEADERAEREREREQPEPAPRAPAPRAQNGPTPGDLSAAVRKALAECAPADLPARLRQIGERLGGPSVLRTLTITLGDGEQPTGADWVRALIAQAEANLEQAARAHEPEQGVRTQDPAQNDAPAGQEAEDVRTNREQAGAHAQEEPIERAQEPAQQPVERAQQPSAQQPAEQTREDRTRAAQAVFQKAEESRRAVHTDRGVSRLIDEIKGQAAVLGLGAPEHAQPLLDAQAPGTMINEVPFARMRRWVLEQRPRVIEALVADARVTEAEAYANAHSSSTVGWWADLTGTRVLTDSTPLATVPVTASAQPAQADERAQDRAPMSGQVRAQEVPVF